MTNELARSVVWNWIRMRLGAIGPSVGWVGWTPHEVRMIKQAMQEIFEQISKDSAKACADAMNR